MEHWWNSLTLPLQVFYATGITAGILLVIEALLTLSGLGHHNLSDSSIDHPDQLGVISVRTITGFFFGFGWSGTIAIKSGLSLIASIAIACAVGLCFLLAIYLLMRGLFSLRASGTLDYRNAIGQVGTVYVTVPPNRGGSGQVEVMIQGRLMTISCLTAHPTLLAPLTKVRVVDLIDQGTVEVQPL